MGKVEGNEQKDNAYDKDITHVNSFKFSYSFFFYIRIVSIRTHMSHLVYPINVNTLGNSEIPNSSQLVLDEEDERKRKSEQIKIYTKQKNQKEEKSPACCSFT